MANAPWNWKNKDGSKPGLLYESGNWGDLLKLLWLDAVLCWKARAAAAVNYLDPFAGDVHYPLGKRNRHRLDAARLDSLDFIEDAFLRRDLWPSSASAARLRVGGTVTVWDADAGRRENWRNQNGVDVAETDSGWTLLAERAPDPDAVWLVDPYDILAEWRDHLPMLIEKSRSVTMLVYIYNRSARSDAAFRDYRAFKNAVEDGRGSLPKRLGRIAGDAFLPRSHHEMLFLPSAADCARPDSGAAMEELCRRAELLHAGLTRVGVCGA